jgi:outer membrane protein TolC
LHQISGFILLAAFFFNNTLLFAPACLAERSFFELDLSKAIEIAQINSPAISESRFKILEAQEEIKEIFGLFRSPRFELISYVGPISDAKGDVTDTSDTNDDYDQLGPFLKVDLTAVQPIYSFGKYSPAMEVGRKNLLMKKAMLRESINSLSFEVTKAFLGVVAGDEGRKIGGELVAQYHNLLERLQKIVNEQDSDIDVTHLLEAQAMFFEIEQLGSKPALKGAQALIYLRGLLNWEQNVRIRTIATTVPQFDGSVHLLSKLLEFSRTHSPLLRSYNFGLAALRKKAELEKKKKYPDLFIAVGAGYGTAPGRDKQTNAFISDNYNYENIGAVLGLKWDFNFHIDSAKEQKAFLEYQKIIAKKKLNLAEVDGKIRRYYNESLRYKRLLYVAGKSLKSAKTWIRVESDNLDLGIGNAQRFIKANKLYYQLKGNEIEMRYHYLVSLAQLAKTAGDMELFLKWLQNGKVQMH